MSLIEVVIATGVLSITAAGLLSGVFQTRRFTEDNIYETAALNAVSSYMEQIKSMPYDTVLATMGDPTNVPLPTVIDHTTADPLRAYVWNHGTSLWTGGIPNDKVITINVDDAGNVIERMDLRVYAFLTNIQVSDSLQAIEVQILFNWKRQNETWLGIFNQTRVGNMKFVRSSIETY